MRTLGLGLLAILATISALLSNGAPVAAEPTDKEKSEMAAKVYTLLKDKCAPCHGAEAKKVMGKKGTLNYILDYDKLISEKLIDTKSPEKSALYEEISEGNMPRELDKDGKPKTKKKLAQAEIDLVLNWLKAGAPKWAAPSEWKWTPVEKAGPPARFGHAMAEGPNGTVVLLGGLGGAMEILHTFDDTWVFREGQWAQASPKLTPKVTSLCSCAYDANRAKTVVYGGLVWGTSDPANTTYEWDGKNWTEIKTTKSPSPRIAPALAYDNARKVIVLFGGTSPTDGSYHDTWEFDGKDWREVPTETYPSQRSSSLMSYDPVTKSILLIGGFEHSQATNDTWLFDGKNWISQGDAMFPADRTGLSIASGSGSLVLCAPLMGPKGRKTNAKEFWTWNGKSWALTGACPFATSAAKLAWCEADKCFVHFGGFLEEGPTDQTWLLSKAK